MDRVIIESLRIDTIIGVLEWEKEIKQTLLLDLEILWDQRKAAATDDYQHALCYASVSKAVEAMITAQPIELVETVAERTAALIMTEFGAPGVKVQVRKLAAITNVKSVGVAITRGDWH
ncbi:dihydroneopterin aldolase [Paraferrimonas sedimenticola]|uniref:7,8-dihydroneopterin aldolase n=1 Tax=Paraferrimonas sedimenticola TaxID=375674 RepID=A0AA37RY59_9GAMM|nr:dihydroneopterin aldolase [Paraferrimonas sedimenticola]GLP97246.1 7,8-dihydroneopterin aldolase [Paraferrimonas sedimenticola]